MCLSLVSSSQHSSSLVAYVLVVHKREQESEGHVCKEVTEPGLKQLISISVVVTSQGGSVSPQFQCIRKPVSMITTKYSGPDGPAIFSLALV